MISKPLQADEMPITTSTSTPTPTRTSTPTPTRTSTPTPTSTSTPTAGLSGGVSFWPGWKEMVVSAVRPTLYLIVLDASDSMSWTFDGRGQNLTTGETVYCAGPLKNANCDSPQWAYGTCDDPNTPQDESLPEYGRNLRRIYLVKEALRSFAQNVQDTRISYPNDVVRILPFSGDLGDFYDANGNPVPNANQPATTMVDSIKHRLVPGAWVNTYAALSGAIENAGMVNGDPYLTTGSTSSASALRAAYEILDGPETPDYVPGNPTMKYRKMVIFITDGGANVFTNGLYNNQLDCSGEFQACNTGVVTLPGGVSVPKPLDAMVAESIRLKASVLTPTNGKLHVIALANADTTGLSIVASGLDALQQANDLESLRSILLNIHRDVPYSECVEGLALSPVNNMGSGNIASIPGWNLGPNEAGYVYLWAEGRNPHVDDSDYSVPIRVDANFGLLSYSFSNLPYGTYQMKAELGVRWLDGVDRLYTNFTDGQTGTTGSDIRTVQINANATGPGGQVNLPVVLQLAASACSPVP